MEHFHDPANWQFQKERSPADNIEGLAQGLYYLSETLDTVGYGQVASGGEVEIKGDVVCFWAETLRLMAKEAQKSVQSLLGGKRRKERRGPGKLVPLKPGTIKTEEEARKLREEGGEGGSDE